MPLVRRRRRGSSEFLRVAVSGSRVDKVTRSPADYPSGSAGDVLTVEFTLAGRPFMGLNGGPQFHFTEAVSFSILCDDQAEVDRLWEALTAGGGYAGPCGWLKDRWGLSWQIVPRILPELLGDPDRTRARRAMERMMTMGKLDVEALRRAADGEA